MEKDIDMHKIEFLDGEFDLNCCVEDKYQIPRICQTFEELISLMTLRGDYSTIAQFKFVKDVNNFNDLIEKLIKSSKEYKLYTLNHKGMDTLSFSDYFYRKRFQNFSLNFVEKESKFNKDFDHGIFYSSGSDTSIITITKLNKIIHNDILFIVFGNNEVGESYIFKANDNLYVLGEVKY